MKRLVAYSFLLTTVAIWGVAAPVIKYTLEFTPPFAFLFWRMLINSVIILPFLLWHLRQHPVKLSDWPRLTFLGFLGASATLALVFLGFDRTTSLDGVLIVSLSPIFIVIGAGLFLKERVTRLERAGLAVAVAGTLIAISEPILESGIFALDNLVGNLLVLGSVFTWAAFVLASKKDYDRHSPFLINGFSFLVALGTFFPAAILEGGFLPTLPQPALPGILYMSLVSSIIAYMLHGYGLKFIEASEASLFYYLQPVFAAPFALFWLGEKITPAFVIGAAVIAAGVILTEYRPGVVRLPLPKPHWG